jgi:hypothetical protein
MRRSQLLALAVALGTALAGCFADATPPPPTPTPAPLATPVITFYRIDTTVWVEGFVVVVRSATASLDAKGGTVTVDLGVANPGTDPATLDAPMDLAAADKTYEVVHGTEQPDVPAGAQVDLNVAFDVIGQSTIDDGILRIGRATDHRVAVPLRIDRAVPITLEPQTADLKGGVTSGGLKLALRHLEVRWDLGDWYLELPLATEALTVSYDISYVGDFSGGYAFTGDNIVLRLPDGTLVAPRPDGHSQSIVLIGLHKTVKTLFSRFEIPSGLTGKFALILTDGSTHKPATFQIGP